MTAPGDIWKTLETVWVVTAEEGNDIGILWVKTGCGILQGTGPPHNDVIWPQTSVLSRLEGTLEAVDMPVEMQVPGGQNLTAQEGGWIFH